MLSAMHGSKTQRTDTSSRALRGNGAVISAYGVYVFTRRQIGEYTV